MRTLTLSVLVIATAACGGTSSNTAPTQVASPLSVFVTSATNPTGNLGGLRGADNRCQTLATAVGAGSKTWRAYLSVERDPDNGNRPTDARPRPGNGPGARATGSPAR